VYFGEIGLSGAIRPVAQSPARLKEALKLGFAKAVTPQGRGETGDGALPTEALRHIADLVAGIASGAAGRSRSGAAASGRGRARYDEEEVD
jgi:DNA repair protein RadA/Sms